MQTIKQDDGTEIEVYTADEIEEQKQQAVDDYKTNNPDKTADIEALQETLAEKEIELEKMKGKDMNFANLRNQKEAAEKKIEEIKGEIDGKISNVKKEVMEEVMRDHYSESLKALSGDDKELEKKIEFHYKRLGDVASTKTDIASKLRDAWFLATKPTGDDGVNANVFASGGVGRVQIKSQATKISAEEKAVGAKFGITDEDFKKYDK